MNNRVLITGADGMLARAMASALVRAGYEAVPARKEDLDVRDPAAVRTLARALAPRAIIQCAAYTDVEGAEDDPEMAFAVNTEGARAVAAACTEMGALIVYPSTDYVFDGSRRTPYRPSDAVGPLNVYGKSKVLGEEHVRTAPEHLIVRTSWLYGAGGRNFVRTIADKLKGGEELSVVSDQTGAPTWTHDLAEAIVGLIQKEARGTLHVTSAGTATWFELASAAAALLGLPPQIVACTSVERKNRARRPPYSVLDCRDAVELIGGMRDWRLALDEALVTEQY